MEFEFGVADLTTYAYERSRLPIKLETHVMRELKQLPDMCVLIVGVADLSGGWKDDFVNSYDRGGALKFLDWVTKHRHEFLGNADEGFDHEARFIILIARKEFDPKDPCHEAGAEADFKGFFRILRERQYEPMET